MADTQADRLAKAIDEVTALAQASVAAYSNLAKQAATQLAGDAPTDAGMWLQLTAKTYAQAVGDTAKVWSAYNDVLGILAEQEEPAADG